MRVKLPLLFALGGTLACAREPIAEIPRVLPPATGVELPAELRETLEDRVTDLKDRVWEISHKTHAADAGALVKAVDFALRHGEFYSEKEFPRAAAMLDLAEARLAAFETEDRPWLKERGLVVRGYRSRIDDSWQPFGLEIPAGLDLSKPVPLLVWLHGRGDKTTDLHFLNDCLKKSQAFGGFYKDQEEVIVLHPFGRHCVGWKHAGEIDVFEAIAAVQADYPIDPKRILLAGFSMGGAGAWHIGAHYRDRFCGIHAGAGFAETREYNRIAPDQMPPEHEQILWKVYDVPNYLRNFLNGPLLAYSGALDKQKATADLMAREFRTIGYDLRHLVAPETEHKYTAEAVAEIGEWMRECREQAGTPRDEIVLQTPTLRYASQDWLRLTGLERQWSGALAKAKWDRAKREIELEVEGVTALEITSAQSLSGTRVRIGKTTLTVNDPGFAVNTAALVRKEGSWGWGSPAAPAKRPGLQGPIEDAFLGRFVLVTPEESPAEPTFARWLDFELAHFRSRWSALMRGDLIEKRPSELRSEDLRDANLILWGDPESNSQIAAIADQLPVRWHEDEIEFRGKRYPRSGFVPVLIFPNPLNPDRYIVLNSGLTFREGHDKTNSQQNPKLPDWAILGFDRDPDALAAGRVEAAGFFDENWK